MDKIIFQIRKELFKHRRNLNSIILYLGALLFIVFVLVSNSSLIAPMKQKYTEQMNTIYLYNANITTLPELSLSSEIMNEKIRDIQDVYEKMNNIVPDKRNVPFVTSQISLAAANNKVDIGAMSKVLDTSVVLGKDKFGVVKYNLVCYSSYENIVNLLATLETSNSIFAIEKVDISPLSEEESKKYRDSSFVKTELDINIYMKSKKS